MSKAVYIITVLAISMAVVFYYQLTALEKEHDVLTTQLTDVTRQLKQEVERRQRIEEITVRLEQAAAEHRAELRRYERDLDSLQGDEAYGPTLDTVIPDAALRGLRTCPDGACN